MTPGRFDVVPQLLRMEISYIARDSFLCHQELLKVFSRTSFGEDYNDIVIIKKIVQQIYNAGYAFPQAPKKPKITITHNDGKVVIYWDGERPENPEDFVTTQIYRATDATSIPVL